MLRNREMRIWIIGMVLLLIMGSSAAYLIDPLAGLMAVIGMLLMAEVTFLFTRWRYRELAKLSAYLERIAAGDYSLDLRDNTEGELSILKSEIYKVTVTLREQAELLKREKRFLADAISDISHQLKTPLTSMFVMIDLLSDEDLPSDKRTEFTQNLRSQLERLQWLVTSLLKLAKIDAGAIPFKKEAVSVKALIERAAQPLLIPMEIKGETLILSGMDQTSFTGDFQWSAEAITNILKNCIEHTPEGGTISIDFTESPLYTLIRISDNGEGVDPEDLPHLFERFYKGKNARPDSIGIGLAMSQSILQHQGGHIEVRSEKGKGTQFTIKMYKRVI